MPKRYMSKRTFIPPKTARVAVFANMEEYMPIIEEQINAGHSVELPPRGISMLPLIREGKDSVILSPVINGLNKYDIPLYRRKDGSYVLHRVISVGDNSYTMAGDNQFIYEKGITDGQIIAVVTAIRRGGRLFSTNNPLYRFYAAFWQATRSLRYFPIRVVRKIKRTFKR